MRTEVIGFRQNKLVYKRVISEKNQKKKIVQQLAYYDLWELGDKPQ